MKEIYVSTDVEADGPIPGPNSMLSFGSAALWPGGEVESTFEGRPAILPGAAQDPGTMAWWAERPAAYERTPWSTRTTDSPTPSSRGFCSAASSASCGPGEN